MIIDYQKVNRNQKVKIHQRITRQEGVTRISQKWLKPVNPVRKSINGVEERREEYNTFFEIKPITDFGTENYWANQEIYKGDELLAETDVFELIYKGYNFKTRKKYERFEYVIIDDNNNKFNVIHISGNSWRLL